MAELSDIETYIAKCALGDRDAFSSLYSATSAKLFGICLRVLGNRSEAEDALQDVFVKIWHNADRYQVNGLSPMTWLITIARNLSIDKLRARKAKAGTGLDEAEDLPSAAPGPEALAIAASDRGKSWPVWPNWNQTDLMRCAVLIWRVKHIKSWLSAIACRSTPFGRGYAAV
jgi:RNA polymerase sigma-70 factor (ECF subfamily)